jgi:radical SAM superfamily enzyme YgiQ (UPF0313 family)
LSAPHVPPEHANARTEASGPSSARPGARPERTLLLIEPPFYRLHDPRYSLERYPLWQGCLASAVRRQTSWRVRALNADFAGPSTPLAGGVMGGRGHDRYLRLLAEPDAPIWRELGESIRRESPEVIGLTVRSPVLRPARRVAEIARAVCPRAKIVLGGPHICMVGRRALEDVPDADLAVFGEGEATLVDLLNCLDRGGEPAALPGVIARGASGEILAGPPRPFQEDLSVLAPAAEGAEEVLVDFHRYPLSAFRSVMATRGCPHNCLFCGSRKIWSRRVRFRPPGSVAAELDALARRGLREVHFEDDTFGVRRAYLRELCAVLAERRRRWGLAFTCEMHVNLVDADTVAAMVRAGCASIQLGVESGDDGVLAANRKGYTLDRALAACETIRRAGAELVTFFMLGLPQETPETLAATERAMKRCGADAIVLSLFTPYPGTEAWDLCREQGTIDADFEPSLHNHQSAERVFSPHLDAAEYRRTADRLGCWADRYNARRRVGRLFSRRTLRRARELGLRGAMRRLRRTFLAR